jgi:hypothetical protein
VIDRRTLGDNQGDPTGAGDRDARVNAPGRLEKLPIGVSIGESATSLFENELRRLKGPLGPC